MNVLIATLGSYGDIYPTVGLAVQLKRRGHHVTLFTNPFFEDLAGKYDLDFVPVGTMAQYERFANHPDLFHPRRSVAVFFRTLGVPSIRSAYERLIEHLRPAETVIVSSITVFAARLVQEKHGIPNITAHVMPMAFKSAHELSQNAMFPFPNWLPLFLKRLYWWVADKAVVDPLICPELNAFRRELGLLPVSRVMTRWGHSPQLVLGLFPSWYASPQPDWPPKTRLTGFPLFHEDEEAVLPPEVSSFLEGGPSPIVFMPASLMQQAEHFFEVAVRSCQALGRRAVFLSRYRDQVPGVLPEGIRHFEYLPLRQILPWVDAFVHQGGIGACALALRFGVPQLIHPAAYDQYDNAWRLRRLGVGDWISPQDWRVPTLTQKIRALTTAPQVREQCQQIARKFEGPEPLIEACEAIESLDRL